MRLFTTIHILLGVASTVVAVPARAVHQRSLNVTDVKTSIDNLINALKEASAESSASSSTFTTDPIPTNGPRPSSSIVERPDSTSPFDPSILAMVNPPFAPKWKIYGSAIETALPSLPQVETNGKSTLGTFDADRYGQYRGQSKWGESKQSPWGQKTAKNTNTYKNAPTTGTTRYYEWTVERATLAPDGVLRSMILVDGSFPGPTIEANWGDMISVTIHNKITGPEEGTSFHWHGFLQKNSQWEDGVPGITQCPIPPGESYTYTFQADLYGTSWWHAHYSAQYAAGLYGAMIIHGPDQEEIAGTYHDDLGPLLIADYFHKDYFSLVQDVMGTDKNKTAPKSDNNMFNGKGIVNCSVTAVNDAYGVNASDNKPCIDNAGLARFNVNSGNSYRLRLINAGVEGLQRFSIDDHDLTVIAYDFVPIVPHTTKVVTLAVGQRADVLIRANQNPSNSYWIRSSMNKCSLTNQPNALALLYYENADRNAVPLKENPYKFDNTTDSCANDDLRTAVPYYPIKPPSKPTRTQRVQIGMGFNETGHFMFTVNNSTFRTNFNRPILHEAAQGLNSSTFPEEWNVYDFNSAESIRIIVDNLTPISHPMHIHGHNMYVLSATNTIYDDPPLVNMDNPTRRDVQILPPKGQIVIQIDADNPGTWPFHCHIAWHVSSGLYMNVMEQPDVLQSMKIPDKNLQLCQKWDSWTNKNTVLQIDSGLKTRSKWWIWNWFSN